MAAPVRGSARPISAIVALLPFLAFFVHFSCVYLNSKGQGPFRTTGDEVYNKYRTDITPDAKTYILMRSIIFPWAVIWLVYAASTIFGHTRSGEGDVSLPLVPQSTYIFIAIGTVSKSLWLVLWDQELFGYAFVAILCSSFAYLFSEISAERHTIEHGQKFTARQLLFIKVVFHNGLALCKEWLFVCSLMVNLAPLLAHRTDLGMNTACTVVLLLLALKMVIWFILDLFITCRYTRHVITPYAAYIIGASAIVLKTFKSNEGNSVISAVMLGAACVMLLIKIVAISVTSENKPVKYAKDQ